MCSYIIYIITKYTAQHIFQQLFIDTLLERISFGTINASIQLVFFFFFHKNSIRYSDYFWKKKYEIFIPHFYFNFSWQRWNNKFNRICNKFSLSHRQIYSLVYYANCSQVYYNNKELRKIIKCRMVQPINSIFLVTFLKRVREIYRPTWPDFICRFLVKFF